MVSANESADLTTRRAPCSEGARTRGPLDSAADHDSGGRLHLAGMKDRTLDFVAPGESTRREPDVCGVLEHILT
jgi:hypothetical protein